MSNAARLRLFVQSRKVPIGVTVFSMSSATGIGAVAPSPVRAVLYSRILDDDQEKLLAEARRLSCDSGRDLEVVDLGQMNPFRRALVSRLVG